MTTDEFGRKNNSNGKSCNHGIWTERQKELKRKSRKSPVKQIPVTKELNELYTKGEK